MGTPRFIQPPERDSEARRTFNNDPARSERGLIHQERSKMGSAGGAGDDEVSIPFGFPEPIMP
jgi:hypothetical protein